MSLLVLAALATASSALRIGDPAPEFAVTSHTGAKVALKDYAGKKVMLWFYPRASTGG